MNRRWSLRIAEVAGIGVYVHATFLILIAWVAFNYWTAAGTLSAVLGGVAFILAIFVCVVLHELGHALAARRYGIRTRDIILLPIGGVARLERMPREPLQELVVALAGPAVNVAIAALLWIWLGFTGALAPAAGVLGGPFLGRLMVVNVALVIFNLLPAFPMDGGRVLRALLALRLDYARATRIAASVGRGMAALFGIAGLFFNPFLLFIALFVWTGASQEEALARSRPAPWGPRGAAGEVTVHPEVIVTRPMEPGRTVAIQLADAVRLLQTGTSLGARASRRMPVIHQGRIVGFLQLDEIGTPLRIERV